MNICLHILSCINYGMSVQNKMADHTTAFFLVLPCSGHVFSVARLDSDIASHFVCDTMSKNLSTCTDCLCPFPQGFLSSPRCISFLHTSPRLFQFVPTPISRSWRVSAIKLRTLPRPHLDPRQLFQVSQAFQQLSYLFFFNHVVPGTCQECNMGMNMNETFRSFFPRGSTMMSKSHVANGFVETSL